MSKQRETRRQRKTRQALETEVGGYWWKQHGGPFTPAGLPDLIGCCHSLFFAIEVKEPDGTISEVQYATAQRIRTEGQGFTLVGCVEPEEAVEFVKAILAKCGISETTIDIARKKQALAKTGSPPKRRRRVRSRKT